MPLYNQLLIAYTKINIKFRIYLEEPITGILISVFLAIIDGKTNVFLDITKNERT